MSFVFLFVLIAGPQGFLAAYAQSVSASAVVPSNLNAVERVKTLEILGFGAASKLGSSPYPLGGYDGVEVAIGTEYIPISDVATMGSKSSARGDLNYVNLTVGKGLYYNVDILIHFIPMPQEESISGFGGQIRWAFYEAAFMPASLSVIAHTSSTNFANVLSAETTGLDFVGSVNMKDVALFVGLGQARSLGSFIGGVNGITNTGKTESASVTSAHTLFGVSIDIGRAFIALQVDRYVQSTYGGKLGWRF